MYTSIIIDDETNARERLIRILQEINAPCTIVAEAQNGFEAIQVINSLKPDLVFLDIEMPGLNGIEVLRHCSHDPFIIFTTAHDQFAIQAFEANTISYLLKPITQSMLLSAINKLHNMAKKRVEHIHTALATLESQRTISPLEFLPVKNGDTISLLKLDSIIWIAAEGKYTIIATQEKTFISNYSLTEIEERLNDFNFLRVHRSYIINLKYIVALQKITDKKVKIILTLPLKEDITVSQNYYDSLKERIGI